MSSQSLKNENMSFIKKTKFEELLASSNGLNETTVVREALNDSEFLLRQIKDATKNAKSDHNSDLPLYNFFSNKKRIEEVNEILQKKEIDFNNAFESISSISKYSEFCLILNHIECYCDELNTSIYEDFTKQLINKLGKPVGGLDYYCFIGSNDKSPPGLHVDHDHTFIFHIGPNEKTILIWEDYFSQDELKTYNMLPESEIDSVSKYATEIILKPRDLIFIPKDVPHYAIYNSPSIMFGITLFPFYTDYIWFYKESDKGSNLNTSKFLNSHDNNIEGNLFLKYPKFETKKETKRMVGHLPMPLAMKFATKPLQADLRFNKGENRNTLKPIYNTSNIHEQK